MIFISANQHIYPFYPTYPPASIYFSEESSNSMIENTILNSTLITSKSPITLKNSTFNFVYISLVRSTISDCTITGSVRVDGTSIVTNNTIIAGRDYYTVGILSDEGSPIISHNIIKSMPSNTLVWGIMFGGNEKAIISDNIISDCEQVGILIGEVNAGKNIVERNLITNNLPRSPDDIGGVGIEVIGTNTTSSNLIIRNNTIAGNSIGINIHGSTLDDANKTIQPTILGNNIFNNSRSNLFLGRPLTPPYGRSLLAGDDINASYNWWGITVTQTINQSIYDFKNDFNLGNVTFIPFLTSPNPQAFPNSYAPIQTPNSSPSPSSRQQPTIEPSQTPDRPKIGDFAPVIIPASMIFLAIVVVGLLVYFAKRNKRVKQ